MGKPILSVVVPTKDRYKYLKHLIKLIQSFNSDEWEIVVQDNTDDNTEIVEFLKEINYSGCKYFHESAQLPMTTNADKAILHSEGEYVCFLGDDDGICPNAIEYCLLMKQKGLGALRSNLANYFWPDANSKYDRSYGRLKIPNVTKSYTICRTNDALMDVVNRGFIDRGNLPSVYHGISDRKALDKVYSKCGTFFPGQSPDISNGVAMALVLDDFIMVDDVITISGASKFHGGATIGNFRRYPQIKDMVWFRPGAEDEWDERLPKIAVGSIIWAESSIETLRNVGRKDIIDEINFETIYKFFVVYHYPVRKLAYLLSQKPLYLKVYAHLNYLLRVWKALIRIVKGKLHLKEKGLKVVNNIDNIEIAVKTITNEK